MKKDRHEMIIQIIKNSAVETQEELMLRLRDAGCNVTQATVSRDIKELQLVKVVGKDGKYKYAVSHHTEMRSAVKFKNILKETVIRCDYAENIVVLKTYAGMAQAAAAAIDSLQMTEIVGSVAGDDTILIVLRTKEIAREFFANYEGIII